MEINDANSDTLPADKPRLERVQCICGKSVSKPNLTIHLRTNIHAKRVQAVNATASQTLQSTLEAMKLRVDENDVQLQEIIKILTIKK